MFVFTYTSVESNLKNSIISNLFKILKLSFRYTVTVRVSEEQPYQVREFVWCLNVPPRCSKYKIKFKTVYKDQNLVKTRPVEECCQGYAKNAAENKCIPVCSTECLHGRCVAPETCECQTGYGGPNCDICKYLG